MGVTVLQDHSTAGFRLDDDSTRPPKASPGSEWKKVEATGEPEPIASPDGCPTSERSLALLSSPVARQRHLESQGTLVHALITQL